MTTVITFADLVKNHGQMEAMRWLEAVECVADIKDSMTRVAQEPEERLADALQRLIETDFAA